MQASNCLTREQRDLLLAVFSDCREFYTSRRAYDCDYKSLSRASLLDLYTGWKSFNASLSSGSWDVEVPILTNWPFSVARSTSDSVRAIRQVLGLYSRLEGNAATDSAIIGFKERVSSTRSSLPKPYVETARNLIRSWLGPAPCLLDLHPKHGPGAVAEGLKNWEKVNFAYTFRQLERVGGEQLLYLNDGHKMHEPRDMKVLKHAITRVICVPKDFMKPRIISAEPQTMQFLQQGVARYMMATVEHLCPYIRFRDQTVNAMLAKRGDEVATLDMSDASDRVSRRIVRQLFPNDWAELLFSLRSGFSKLPDGTVVPLRAFAPMGSALCFPVEAIVFAAVTVAVLCHIDGGSWFSKEKRKLVGIYGDDIIVPRDAGEAVLAVLRATGFTPNVAKCCLNGFFRESCGAEWWRGDDVTVVRPRSLSPLYSPQDTYVSCAEMPMALHAKRLYETGFLNAAQWLADRCVFPVAIGDGPGYMPSGLNWKKPGKFRWNPKYQRLEQQTTCCSEQQARSYVGDSYAALFLGLCSGWQSHQVCRPRIKPKTTWVLASPLSER